MIGRSIRHGVIAVVLAVAAWGCLQWSRLEDELASVAQRHAALDFAVEEPVLENAARWYGIAGVLPLVGNGPANALLAERAAAHYWRGNHAALVPAQGDPVAVLPPDAIALQVIVANAAYRRAESLATDLPTRLQAIDAGIAAQLAVLRNAGRHEGVAYNYEYLVRLRAALAAPRGQPRLGDALGEEKTQHGMPGGEPQESQENNVRIHTPLEPREFQDQKAGERAGKTVERKRRG